ncbi:hypothetical protein ABZ669_13385 [Streptomyces hirsutus]|uniref:hypothetical protein n=1 Tax=Streptomyces TaxID=1883 RepID=UPI002FC97DEC
MTTPEEERRVQDAVRRHARTRAFAEAEDVISALLSDPGVREARARVEAAETDLGIELRARLQAFQDRYEQAVTEGDADRLTEVCAGKHGSAKPLPVRGGGREWLRGRPGLVAMPRSRWGCSGCR